MRAVLGSFGSEADDVPVGLVVELEAVPPVTGLQDTAGGGNRVLCKPSGAGCLTIKTGKNRPLHITTDKKMEIYMQLSKIKIKNYRLLIDAELEVDSRTTLIVGRNSTAKTSCFSCIGKVLNGEAVSFDDYPLLRRKDFYTKIALFMEKKLTYEDLCKHIEIISIDFLVDYSLDDLDDNLGALSPFIIDVDVDTTTALIRAEYRLKTDKKPCGRSWKAAIIRMVPIRRAKKPIKCLLIISANCLD